MIAIILITALLFFTLCSGTFSASETALFSLSRAKLSVYREHEDKSKQKIARLVSRPHKLLITILILNIFVNIIIQNIASNLFEYTPGLLFKIGVPLFLTLIFGEIIPKSIALQNNTKIAKLTAPILELMQKVLKPIRSVLTPVANYVSRWGFFFLKKESAISKNEMHHILVTSKNQGVLTTHEASLINGLIKFQDLIIKELMLPKDDVSYYDIDEPLSKLISFFASKEFSRVPVCQGDLNNINGIITAHKFFLNKENITSPKDLLPILDRPFFVPETTYAKALLQQFRNRNEEFAVVVDEYGSVNGIITKEDLVEVITGDIEDKHRQEKHYTTVGEGVIIASSKLELIDFENIFSTKLESKSNMTSIGGWLIEQLETIPKMGTKYILEDFLFHILSADPNRIKRIYIRKLRKKK